MTTTEPESTTVRTSYRVSWTRTGTDKPRTVQCLITSDMMQRGDRDERNLLLRKIIANRYLPIGEMQPENVTLLDVAPVCNCEPFPGENCAYAEHKGQRFYLTRSEAFAGCEVIHDRHRDKLVGIVSISESVEFLTLLREKYGHQ